jgi:hypothetical protein
MAIAYAGAWHAAFHSCLLSVRSLRHCSTAEHVVNTPHADVCSCHDTACLTECFQHMGVRCILLYRAAELS